MNILICDDDALVLEHIKAQLHQYYQEKSLSLPSIYCFQSGADLLLSDVRKDVVFLDVEMPGISGIEAGRRIKDIYPRSIIIMVTSHDQFLDDAMDFGVFRYLSKPIDPFRFDRCVTAALKRFAEDGAEITFSSKHGLVSVHSSEIYFLEPSGHGSIIYREKDFLSCPYSLDEWTALLPPASFFRTHRGNYVNLEHVTATDGKTVMFEKIPYKAKISRRSLMAFQSALLFYRAAHSQ